MQGDARRGVLGQLCSFHRRQSDNSDLEDGTAEHSDNEATESNKLDSSTIYKASSAKA